MQKKLVVIASLIIILVVMGFLFNKYRQQEFKITLMVDGEIYSEKLVKYNTILDLEDLSKEGYTFLGWYMGNQKYNHQKVKKSLVLEAKWEAFSNYVLFDAGDGQITKVPVQYNNPVKEIAKPTKNGYVFLGWFYNDELFDFQTKITSNITLKAKWEVTKEKQGVSVASYFRQFINDQINFKTQMQKEKITVNIIRVNNKLANILNDIQKKTNELLKRDDIKSIIINYQNNEYNINRDNISSEIDTLFNDLTSTSNKEYSNRLLSSLYNKKLKVELVLDSKYYYALDSNSYEVEFTSDKIITKKEMDDNSLKSVSYIKLYDVAFDSQTHVINVLCDSNYAHESIASILYHNSHSGGGTGTGLNDAMQNFASNQNIFQLVMIGNDKKEYPLTRDKILSLAKNSTSLLSLGNNIIKSMGINGRVTNVKQEEIVGRQIKLRVDLVEGFAFEDGFQNEYDLVIKSK